MRIVRVVTTERISECAHCQVVIIQPATPGRQRQFCSGACRTAAYRTRKAKAGTA